MDRGLVDKHEAQIEQLQARRRALEKELKQAEKRGNYNQVDECERQMTVCANKIKRNLFRLGRYRFPADEMVEYAPGQFMQANQYYWLLND